MRQKLLYSLLLFIVGACQRADVKPAAPAKSAASASANQTANCGDPQSVSSYMVRWGFANSSTYFTRTVGYPIQSYKKGYGYQPLQMNVRWDQPLCLGPLPADYLDVILHLPDGSTQAMGRFNPSAGDKNTVVTIPPVIIKNDTGLVTQIDDATQGGYYVEIQYGISGSTYWLANGSSDTSGSMLAAGNGRYSPY